MKTLIITCLLFSLSLVQAQLKATVSLKYTDYIQYEKVGLRIKLENRSGQDFNLDSEPWINIFVERSGGSSLVPAFEIRTPAKTLGPNQSITFEANLNQVYDISQLGNYSVFLVGNPKEASAPIYSNRKRFSIHEPRIIKTARPVVEQGQPVIEYRLLEFSRFSKDYLYLQCYSIAKGYPLNTVGLGGFMRDFKPSLRVSKSGKAVEFHQQNQQFFVMSELNINGTLASFKHYVRANEAKNPQLYLDNKGLPFIANGRFYDPEAEAKKALILKKVSQRPPGF